MNEERNASGFELLQKDGSKAFRIESMVTMGIGAYGITEIAAALFGAFRLDPDWVMLWLCAFVSCLGASMYAIKPGKSKIERAISAMAVMIIGTLMMFSQCYVQSEYKEYKEVQSSASSLSLMDFIVTPAYGDSPRTIVYDDGSGEFTVYDHELQRKACLNVSMMDAVTDYILQVRRSRSKYGVRKREQNFNNQSKQID